MSVDMPEHVYAQPWPVRTFPLTTDEEQALNLVEKPENSWKVVSSATEELQTEKGSLVLKLSKA